MRNLEYFELKTLETFKKIFTAKVQEAWEQINRLQDILSLVRKMNALDKCQSQIEKEIQHLSEEKSLTEREIELYNLNFTVVNECLTLRDEKTSNDLCRDAVERELNSELKTLETFKKIFTAKVQEAWEQINRLQDIRYKILCDINDKEEAVSIDSHCLGLDKHSANITLKHNVGSSMFYQDIRYKILCDINDKEEAVSIDSHCLGLDKHSANITLKHNALKSPQSQIPHEAWLENARYLKQRGESEVSASKKLRESIVLPRDQSHNELCTQNEQTNYAMRKRIYETMKIRNELEWQKTVVS
ncbi:tektin-2 [Diaphorina citri]|uniref:Tektin n=1 Tax=Diaphorina citri TaxID=121845 RepID=A0A3Q0IN61_DIACI|nr:tektin-2 [Diaphorina citri]